MYCPKCGAEIPEGYRICMKCGYNTENNSEDVNPPGKTVQNPEKKSKKKPILWIGVVLTLAVIIGAGFFLAKKDKESCLGVWKLTDAQYEEDGEKNSWDPELMDSILTINEDHTYTITMYGDTHTGTWEKSESNENSELLKGQYLFKTTDEWLSFFGGVYDNNGTESLMLYASGSGRSLSLVYVR